MNKLTLATSNLVVINYPKLNSYKIYNNSYLNNFNVKQQYYQTR
jgi:hypothetical protein